MEEQQLFQLQINATADDQVLLQMETELEEVDARRATLIVALASSHTHGPTRGIASQQVVSGLFPPPGPQPTTQALLSPTKPLTSVRGGSISATVSAVDAAGR
jgi:hypothetical protein